MISIDLSPAGGLLATGSGDWQARVCEFISSPVQLQISDSFLVCVGRYGPA